MKPRHLLFVCANFFAVLFLAALVISPFYFAKNFTKASTVAGVQTVAPPKLEFKAENFPNLAFSQNGDKYLVSFTKIGPTQAYLGIGVLTNQTNIERTYELQTQNRAKVFFGQNIEEQKSQIALAAGVSTFVSILSPQEASASSQTVEFEIGE